MKNIFQYGNKDYTGKIFISSAAYYYRFIEYGADVKPRHGKYLAFKVGDEWKKRGLLRFQRVRFCQKSQMRFGRMKTFQNLKKSYRRK